MKQAAEKKARDAMKAKVLKRKVNSSQEETSSKNVEKRKSLSTARSRDEGQRRDKSESLKKKCELQSARNS